LAPHERALVGARAALKAGAHPMLGGYTAAFTGWDSEQRARFRAGQAAFGASRQAAKQGDHETALSKGAECIALAERLGAWWGTAMGLGVQGKVLAALGRHEEALAALSRARQIHHDLGLFSSAVGNLDAMIEVCAALHRTALRGELARQRLVLANEAGDTGMAERMRAVITETLGDAAPGIIGQH